MSDHAAPPHAWLLLIYRVPQEPPGRRTYVWRQLKQLGAVYLQQAAAILPDQPELRAAQEARLLPSSTAGGSRGCVGPREPGPRRVRSGSLPARGRPGRAAGKYRVLTTRVRMVPLRAGYGHGQSERR